MCSSAAITALAPYNMTKHIYKHRPCIITRLLHTNLHFIRLYLS